jgi:hypothetical protein
MLAMIRRDPESDPLASFDRPHITPNPVDIVSTHAA